MTPELERLRRSLEQLDDLVNELELTLVDDPRWGEPSETSYLNDEDRADPDIMSNVEAMAATNELIAWFGQDNEGYLGLWRGPKNTHLPEAPVVQLDSEGQYRLVAPSIGNYLAIASSEDDFARTRQVLLDAGFAVEASREAIWATLERYDSPNDYRHKLYNQARVRRGLEPIP
jgi:hypothetical protein